MRNFSLVVIAVAVMFLGFRLGRNYERRQVEKYLPQMMDGMCVDCESIGYKQGRVEGLATCDDVLNQEDDNRR